MRALPEAWSLVEARASTRTRPCPSITERRLVDQRDGAALNEILVDESDHLLVITINRPEARNAINRAVAVQLAAALDRLAEEPDLRVGILTGAGSTFSAGMDLKAFLRGESPAIENRGLAGLTQAPPEKPLIAAVEGWALAGGCELVLACDLVVASRSAKFGIPEVKRGLVAAGGGLLRLPQRIPYHVAMQLALTGEPMDAETARGYGLVNVLTAPGEALAAAFGLAAEVARNGPLAVAATKAVVRGSRDWSEADGWALQEAIIRPVFASEDAREGAAAFAEKRDPLWRGR
jgi:enoyl-CoA hydratase